MAGRCSEELEGKGITADSEPEAGGRREKCWDSNARMERFGGSRKRRGKKEKEKIKEENPSAAATKSWGLSHAGASCALRTAASVEETRYPELVRSQSEPGITRGGGGIPQ